MSNGFAVVDLFAGPGGLAEGFSAVRTPDGARAYRVALSVEMDTAAHSTLLSEPSFASSILARRRNISDF